MKVNEDTAVPEMPSYSEMMAEKLRFNFTENIQKYTPKLESFTGFACKLGLKAIVFPRESLTHVGGDEELTMYEAKPDRDSLIYVEVMPDGQVYNLCGKNVSLELRDGVLVFGGSVED